MRGKVVLGMVAAVLLLGVMVQYAMPVAAYAPSFDTDLTPEPDDGATGVSLSPTLKVYFYDADQESVDVTFYDASDDSVIGTGSAVTSVVGVTHVSTSWSGLSGSTTYSWYATLDDGTTNVTSDTFSFMTQSNDVPYVTDISPAAGATDVAVPPTLSVDVVDNDGDDMSINFYAASDNSIIGTDTVSGGSGTASTSWSGLSGDTTYGWYVLVSDGDSTYTSVTWYFTTTETATNNPPYIDIANTPSPANGAVGTDTSVTLKVYLYDANGDSVKVTFYDASDDSVIGTDTVGTYPLTMVEADVAWSSLLDNTTYSWYATMDDQNGSNVTTSTWGFTTAEDSGGGGWLSLKIPLDWFSMGAMITIGLLGIAVAAILFKPESVKALGLAPAIGTLFITLLIVADVLLYHAGYAWYILVAVGVIAGFVFFVTLKIVWNRRSTTARKIFSRS